MKKYKGNELVFKKWSICHVRDDIAIDVFPEVTRQVQRRSSLCCREEWSVWCSALMAPLLPVSRSWVVTLKSVLELLMWFGECVCAWFPGFYPSANWTELALVKGGTEITFSNVRSCNYPNSQSSSGSVVHTSCRYRS